DGRGGARDTAAVGGRQQAALRQVLHRGERPPLHAAGRAAPNLRVSLRPQGDRGRSPDRGRLRRHRPGAGSHQVIRTPVDGL
ncbi:MAG: dehydrogenase, partial [uncultured Rubrobacteraceae bacterium]